MKHENRPACHSAAEIRFVPRKQVKRLAKKASALKQIEANIRKRSEGGEHA